MNKDQKKEPLAYEIKRHGRELANPFKLSQARDAPRSGVRKEFYPTSVYWSRFNHTNEVLVGTRGSGKTMLLRMLSYSHYKDSLHITEKLDSLPQKYFGIYIPLRLELLNEIDPKDSKEVARSKFCFIFNCVAIASFLNEIQNIIDDISFPEESERLLLTRRILNHLIKLWQLGPSLETRSISDLSKKINFLFLDIRSNWQRIDAAGPLKLGLLEPIIPAIPFITESLKMNADECSWMACFDEAEYLPEDFQAVINTLMRSEIGGFVVKVATLPMHWKCIRTTIDGVNVQSGGDDFVFTSIDHDWQSAEFRQLSNSLLVSRLCQTGIYDIDSFNVEEALEQFLGSNNDKPLIKLYETAFGSPEALNIERDVFEELKKRSRAINNDNRSSGQIKRYMPAFMLKRIYQESRKGNTKIPWLAGARMARRATSGNVRRFIQLCDLFYEKSKASLLKPNVQHDTVQVFARRFCDRSASVYREGFLLRRILERLSSYLHSEFHGSALKDVGLEIELSSDILKEDRMRAAFEAGIAYSYFHCTDEILFQGLSGGCKLKLTDAFGAYNWLIMRSGEGTLISMKSDAGQLLLREKEILSEENVDAAVAEIQMDFFDSPLI